MEYSQIDVLESPGCIQCSAFWLKCKAECRPYQPNSGSSSTAYFVLFACLTLPLYQPNSQLQRLRIVLAVFFCFSYFTFSVANLHCSSSVIFENIQQTCTHFVICTAFTITWVVDVRRGGRWGKTSKQEKKWACERITSIHALVSFPRSLSLDPCCAGYIYQTLVYVALSVLFVLRMVPELCWASCCVKLVRYCMYMWLPMYLYQAVRRKHQYRKQCMERD